MRFYILILFCAAATLSACGVGAGSYSSDLASSGKAMVDGSNAAPGESTPPTAADLPNSDQPIALAPPALAENLLLIPNRTHDNLTLVNTQTMAVETLPVGKEPTQVYPAGSGKAVIFNSGDHSLTILTLASRATTTVVLPQDENAITIDPRTGRGIGFVDSTIDTSKNATTPGLITLVDALAVTATSLSLGEVPVAIRFADSGVPRVVILTATQLFRISFAPWAYERIPFADTVDEMHLADGANTITVRTHTQGLRVIDAAGNIQTIPLPQAATDLDRQSNGDLFGVAPKSVSEGTWLFKLDPTTLLQTGVTVPVYADRIDLDAQANSALLWHLKSNTILFVDLSSFPAPATEIRTVVLPIRQVVATGNNRFLLAHDQSGNTAINPLYRNTDVVTVFNVASSILAPIRLNSAFSNWQTIGGGRYLFGFRSDSPDIALIDMQRQFASRIELPGPTQFAGSLATPAGADGRLYASQNHPLGRLSFVDVYDSAGDIRYQLNTITGFELNAQIER